MRMVLVVALLSIVSCRALCVPVDASSLDGIAAVISTYDGFSILTVDGEYWAVQIQTEGIHCELGYTVPIPVSEIRDWHNVHILAENGDVWKYDGSPDAHWMNYGPISCLHAVDVQSKSYGGVKSLYR